jgi:transcription antitermination protein NusB
MASRSSASGLGGRVVTSAGGCQPSDRIRSRRAGRRVALASVFEAEFGQRTATAVLERQLAETEADPAAGALARSIVEIVVANRDTIDARIEAAAPQYPVVQLARMDRALLRCALGEVLHSATPARVAIAEWVELARIYSGDPMRRLMNGVLGTIARETSGVLQSTPNSEEGVSGHDLRATQEDRRRAARRR